MTLPAGRPLWPVVAFAAFAGAVYLASVGVVAPALAWAPRPDRLAAALAVDVAVLVPLAWAGVIVRRKGRWWTLAPVVVLSAAGAWLVLPAAHHDVLAPLAVLLPVVEVVAVTAVVVALVRSLRRPSPGDALDRIRAATTHVLGDGVAARALAYELCVLRYALGPHVAAEAGAFGYRRSSGYGAVLAGIGVAGVLELVGGHVLVRHLWGDGAALVHLALSGYALVWLVGDWRALGARPIRLHGDVLQVRCGLRWSVAVPVADVRAVYHVRGPLPADRPVLNASVLGTATFCLDLSRPVVAEGPYGVRRRVERVAVGVDEPERFLAAMAGAMRAA